MHPIQHTSRNRAASIDTQSDAPARVTPAAQSTQSMPITGVRQLQREMPLFSAGSGITRARVSQLQLQARSFAGTPAGTVAICPSGDCVVNTHPPGTALADITRFQLRRPDGTLRGHIDVRIVKVPGDDCMALTWIEKSHEVEPGAADFAMWYLASHTDTATIEVHNLVNGELGVHLWKNYEMEEAGDNDLRGDTKKIASEAAQRLTRHGWTLAGR